MKKPASMSTIRYAPEEAEAPGDESSVRTLNTKNVRQLKSKMELGERYFRDLQDDDEPLAPFDHCYLDDEIVTPNDALDVADAMLEHLVDHVFRVLHNKLHPSAKRYSYRRFLTQEADQVSNQLFPDAYKLVYLDKQQLDASGVINALIYRILIGAVACHENIQQARRKLATGRPALMDLIGIGQGLRCVQDSVGDLRKDGLFHMVALSERRAVDGKKGAKSRSSKVTAETVRAAQQRLIAAKMNRRLGLR